MSSNIVHRIPGAYHDDADGQDYALGCQFWFDAADPAAVVVRCPQPHGEVVDWMFGRTLLAHGLHNSAGLALLHIEPCPARDHVNITACFDHSLAVVSFPMVPVEAFLAATVAMCALGEVAEEGTYIDHLAAEYLDLLGEWPR